MGMTMISIVVIAICLLPFILLSLNKSKKNAVLKSKLIDYAVTNNCTISQSDLSHEILLGIDEVNHKFFFVDLNNKFGGNKVFDLLQFEKCVLQRKTKNIILEKKTSTIIDKLFLELSPKNNSGTTSIIPLYDAGIQLELTNELELADKWQGIIQSNLN